MKETKENSKNYWIQLTLFFRHLKMTELTTADKSESDTGIIEIYYMVR